MFIYFKIVWYGKREQKYKNLTMEISDEHHYHCYLLTEFQRICHIRWTFGKMFKSRGNSCEKKSRNLPTGIVVGIYVTGRSCDGMRTIGSVFK